MRRFFSLLGALLLAAPAFSADNPCMRRSETLLGALNAGHYVLATRHFDRRVKAGLPVDTLKQVWTQILPATFGEYDAHAKGRTRLESATTTTVTPLHFAHGWLNMVVSCNAQGEIAGLHFVPGAAPSTAASHGKPHVISGEWGISTRTHVHSPLGPLPATLVLPHGNGPFAAVVLVAGSGPQDRNETIGPNKPLRDLARGLARRGIASLRYDKRTLAHGAQMVRKAITIDDEVTDDAVSAAKLLAQHAHIDARRVFVLGHSLGGMLAPRIGKRDPHLAGLILMAAPARPLLAVSAQQVREQGRRAGLSKAKIADNEKRIAVERKRLARADPSHPPAGRFGPAPQSYWWSLHRYHQLAVAKSLSMPMLILQGKADFQVSPQQDFARWKNVLAHQRRVRFHLYPGLNHLFMPAGKTQTPADYQKPAHVDAAVIADIAAWIKQQ